jgi:hypothetical protein
VASIGDAVPEPGRVKRAEAVVVQAHTDSEPGAHRWRDALDALKPVRVDGWLTHGLDALAEDDRQPDGIEAFAGHARAFPATAASNSSALRNGAWLMPNLAVGAGRLADELLGRPQIAGDRQFHRIVEQLLHQRLKLGDPGRRFRLPVA